MARALVAVRMGGGVCPRELGLPLMVVHSRDWTSAQGLFLVDLMSFWRSWGECTLLYHEVPRQMALGILVEKEGWRASREVIAAEARDMEPTKGRSHAQKEKWGMRKERALGSLGRREGEACRE